MAPFDISLYDFLFCTISKLFEFNNRDFEIWVRGHSRAFKLVPFESLGVVSYSPLIVTMVLPSIKIKRDIGRNRNFFHTPVWYGETRMVGLADGEKS